MRSASTAIEDDRPEWLMMDAEPEQSVEAELPERSLELQRPTDTD